MDNANNSPWMTIEEAADYLRCSVRYLKEKAALREIPFTKLAGKALFHRDKIDQWMFENEYKEQGYSKQSDESNESADVAVHNCDREQINSLINQLIDYNERFVTGLGSNLKTDLANNDYQQLSVKVYAQLSRWCHPNRHSQREKWVKPIAHQISMLLYGKVIPRTKHPSYYG